MMFTKRPFKCRSAVAWYQQPTHTRRPFWASAFGNLSGVYLYATLISALPLHVALAEIWLERHGCRPATSVALALFSLGIIAAQVFLLTAIAFAVSPTHLSQT
ncbi:MAG: hypothetical protein ACNA7Q_13640 [Rhodobacterales bacterium]